MKILETRELKKYYGRQEPIVKALDGVNLAVEDGAFVAIVGTSGSGKSTLLNTLAGEELMVVKSIREDDARGRHTTTYRQLIKLPTGALIIDTPGMRELGLWNADEGISAAFADIEKLFLQCRFSNCSHKKEPGCAIQAALINGNLSQEQWKGYLLQKSETAFVVKRTGYPKGKRKD